MPGSQCRKETIRRSLREDIDRMNPFAVLLSNDLCEKLVDLARTITHWYSLLVDIFTKQLGETLAGQLLPVQQQGSLPCLEKQ